MEQKMPTRQHIFSSVSVKLPNAKRKKKNLLSTIFKHYLTKERYNYIRNNILYIHIFFGHYERVRSENEPRLLLARVGDVFLFHTRRQYFYNLVCFEASARRERVPRFGRERGKMGRMRKIMRSSSLRIACKVATFCPNDRYNSALKLNVHDCCRVWNLFLTKGIVHNEPSVKDFLIFCIMFCNSDTF